MIESKQKKFLVIGSHQEFHPYADEVVSWHDVIRLKTPYLGDYHVLIINLQSLSEEHLINKKVEQSFDQIKLQITDVLWAKEEIKIFCITNHTMYNSNGYSNYDWSPFSFFFVKAEGNSFSEETDIKYFRLVKKWNYYLEKYELNSYKTLRRKHVKIHIEPLLKNLVGKPISFSVFLIEYNIQEDLCRTIPVDKISSNTIFFLPPPTECSVEDAINFLIEEQKGFKKNLIFPSWTEKINLFYEAKLKNQIKKIEKKLEETRDIIEKMKNQLNSIVKYKKLIFTDGVDLEDIVKESLKLLGLIIKDGPKGKEDKILIDPITKSEIPVEITGVKNSIPESKLNQLIGRLSDEDRLKKIKCVTRGVLIGNHYKEIPLDDKFLGRKKPFEKDLIDKAVKSKIVLISTLELLKAVNAKLKGNNIENFVEKIFYTTGELVFKL